MVAVDQEDGTVGYDGVEPVPGRAAAVEGLHGPAAAGDPLLVRMAVGVGPYRGEGVRRRTGLRKVALPEFEAAW